jgi:protein-tyrosine phosphatase
VIDIHCHIIPGVDDGSQSLEESLAIAQIESEGGTRTFITTPHVLDTPDIDRVALFRERLAGLQERLDEAGIPVRLAPGVELYPFSRALEAMDEGAELGLGVSQKYVLVDTPFNQFPNDFDSFLFGLQSRGKTAILAHPERSAVFAQEPERMLEFARRGMVLQVNAGSLRGRYGPVAKAFAERLLARRLADLVASDIHHPGERPSLGTFVSTMTPEIGEEYVQHLTQTAPQSVLAGQPLPSRPIAQAEPPKREGFLQGLFKKRGPEFTF